MGWKAGPERAAGSQVVRQFRGTIDSTGTSRPLSGWNELAREETPLWARGFPVMVDEAWVAAPAEGEGAGLVLGFQNLSGQDILGVLFSVKCYDLRKQELKELRKLSVQELHLAPGGRWCSEKPFPLPDKDTRRVELTVKNVVFANGTIWTNETKTALAPLMAQPGLDLPQDLAAELFRESRAHISGHDPEKIFRFRPQNFGDCWRCACGQMNLGEVCLTCAIKKEVLFDLARPERLSEIKEARLARQRRQEEERRIAGQTEEARQQTARQRAVRQQVVKPSKQAGVQAKTAKAKKTGPSKRTILTAACVCAAVLALLLGASFGLRAYLHSQEEKAQLQAQQEEEERRQEEERRREEQAAQELAEWEAQYILPYSDEELLDESALSGMSEAELWLAKCEILARHGRVFSTPEYAQYFETKPWYSTDASFSEDEDGALSDVERANIDLIDQILLKRKNAQAASALLAKLGEYSERLTVQEATPVDGAYFGLSELYEDPRKQVSWNTSGGISSAPFSGLLCAKTVDIDHDGTPELVTISLVSGDSDDICVEFWRYDGETVVSFAETAYLNLIAASGESTGEMSYLPGSGRDYFRLSVRSSGTGWTAQEDVYISMGERTQLRAVSNTDLEEGADPVETYSINGQETSKESYDQRQAELSQQEGTLWVDSYLNSDFWSEASAVWFSGGLFLDGPKETAAAEAYLTELANG